MSGTALLDDATIDGIGADLPGWTVSEDRRSLRFSRRFADFDAAFAFVSAVAALARARDHHPDLEFGWGYVRIALTTHSAGGLTARDVLLASDIDGVAPA